jgi:hypothetical protein
MYPRQMYFIGNRKYLQPERIDQVMLEECLNEICASINVQIRPFLLLNFSDFFGTGIFFWPAWGLYDPIKGDKFKHINFSHDGVPSSPI